MHSAMALEAPADRERARGCPLPGSQDRGDRKQAARLIEVMAYSLLIGRRHMRFALVNGRTPRPQRRREVEDGDRIYAETLVVPPEQASRPECEEFSEALGRLPDEMREAVLLIGAYGFSYREAASLSDCAVGTIKSRANRARTCRLLGCLYEHFGEPAGEQCTSAGAAPTALPLTPPLTRSAIWRGLAAFARSWRSAAGPRAARAPPPQLAALPPFTSRLNRCRHC
jgi:Sigma-70, region 4